MADIRIKDLTTTASTTAADDFFAADGATNGTRKLSAYNPSFGGNATVGGTLTVSNQLKVTNATIPDLWLQNSSGATSAYRNILIRQNSDNTFKFLSTSDAGILTKDNIITGSNDTGAIGIGVAPGSGTSSLTVAGAVTISSTTASTTTSTGALVVGNGTSGGLGVGGAANIGGNLTVNGGTSTINASAGTDAKLFIKQNATNAAYLIIETTNVVDKAYAGIQYVDDGSIRWSIGGVGQYVNAAYDFNVDVAGANALSINRTTRNVLIGGTTDISGSNGLKVFGTTASTSTSSGALVVSGGVGVAGAIYAGGDIITTKSNGVIKASGSSANAEVAAERLTLTPSSVSMVAAVSQPQLAFTSDTAGSYTWGRILANSSEIVRVYSANLAAISNVAGAGIAVAGGIINTGSLTTGAPSGGTAAAWKLGAVASVSPTSPNRTIEVDIGGTIYYIHAKTTNN